MTESNGEGSESRPGDDAGEPGLPGDRAASTSDPAALDPVPYDAPWREAGRRFMAAWEHGHSGTRVALAIAGLLAAALLGAFLFGLWHVVVGGFLNGNWNAAGFGFALASVAGVLLWIEASIARRFLPSAPPVRDPTR